MKFGCAATERPTEWNISKSSTLIHGVWIFHVLFFFLLLLWFVLLLCCAESGNAASQLECSPGECINSSIHRNRRRHNIILSSAFNTTDDCGSVAIDELLSPKHSTDTASRKHIQCIATGVHSYCLVVLTLNSRRFLRAPCPNRAWVESVASVFSVLYRNGNVSVNSIASSIRNKSPNEIVPTYALSCTLTLQFCNLHAHTHTRSERNIFFCLPQRKAKCEQKKNQFA